MTRDLELPSDRGVTRGAASQATAVEQARAVAEVAAAVQVAQQFPRDEDRCADRMRRSCATRALADRAFYSLPRGGKTVDGSTVHLMRELAGCWGNVDYGVRELRRDDAAGESEMLAWAWDQQHNARSSRSFVVPHARMANRSRQALTDLADIANNNNSVAARALRETIRAVLPVWFVTEAEDIAARTLAAPAVEGQTFEQQVAEAVTWFTGRFGVSRQQLEDRLGHRVQQWSPQDLAFLRVMGGELTRGEKRVDDEFPQRQVTVDEVRVGPSGES